MNSQMKKYVRWVLGIGASVPVELEFTTLLVYGYVHQPSSFLKHVV